MSGIGRTRKIAWLTNWGESHLIGAHHHRDGLLAAQRRDDLGLGERLQQLDGHQTDLDPAAAQVGQ